MINTLLDKTFFENIRFINSEVTIKGYNDLQFIQSSFENCRLTFCNDTHSVVLFTIIQFTNCTINGVYLSKESGDFYIFNGSFVKGHIYDVKEEEVDDIWKKITIGFGVVSGVLLIVVIGLVIGMNIVLKTKKKSEYNDI
ncbi:hypothetical protein EIN_278420 [Entamoeba invadens IP1]|uniref:Uncharacterized protein n=1 Tax=Entamoeba invadens IP1 TaxID=370355 RepID=A0A0A1TVF1_ENTIV|nr:hypothetical protein EIN_278420 [Entamoeba invadens IP1]ELP84352.1 hypothetical protein EIN_278420 [Entamoeba invadens IP1]|eukprot:XP_004183698.1 hypothetical protein EIN_278420 [Entamoeba invadens IP1]